MKNDEERRKDYIDLSEIKINLAVAISELQNTNANFKKLDDEHQKLVERVDKLSGDVANIKGSIYGASMASGFFGAIIGVIFKGFK